MEAFHGKPPGGSAGEMSRRTERLRPTISLRRAQVAEARRLRRLGAEPEQIATALGVAFADGEKGAGGDALAPAGDDPRHPQRHVGRA